MSSFQHEKYSHLKINRTLKQCVNQYCEDYDRAMRSDPKLKIIGFLTYLTYAFLKRRIDSHQLIKKFDESGLIKIYVDMLNANAPAKTGYAALENVPFLNNSDKQIIANALTYVPELTKLVHELLTKYRLKINMNKLNELIHEVVQFLLINYHAKKFHVSAKDNLEDDYESKVKFAMITCDNVASIHKLLRELLPKHMDLLVVYLNEIMEKLV
ncbi:MAG: hypothetical protein LBV37_03040 [Mycoplasmataceae bacterium]|jgi:hypothetical protein|nr:hypothetical protein [Mycoplasmataceae bacterium]